MEYSVISICIHSMIRRAHDAKLLQYLTIFPVNKRCFYTECQTLNDVFIMHSDFNRRENHVEEKYAIFGSENSYWIEKLMSREWSTQYMSWMTNSHRLPVNCHLVDHRVLLVNLFLLVYLWLPVDRYLLVDHRYSTDDTHWNQALIKPLFATKRKSLVWSCGE